MAINVLIVDDSSLTRKRIKRIIEMAEPDVVGFTEAENGQEALKIVNESNVDLVLADLNMPEMGGAEMVHRMKTNEATKSIPVVVVSTESKTTRIKELLAEGVKEYLHKPFTPEEFKEIIQSLWSEPTVETESVLTQALSEALETMAFLTIIPTEDDIAIPEKTILAEISFTGAKTGTIQILAGLDFGRILAENIGNLTDVDNEACFDGLKELANVTCGLFIPMVCSSTADMFEITVPTVEYCEDSSQWHKFTADQDGRVLNIEGYAVATKLVIEDK